MDEWPSSAGSGHVVVPAASRGRRAAGVGGGEPTCSRRAGHRMQRLCGTLCHFWTAWRDRASTCACSGSRHRRLHRSVRAADTTCLYNGCWEIAWDAQQQQLAASSRGECQTRERTPGRWVASLAQRLRAGSRCGRCRCKAGCANWPPQEPRSSSCDQLAGGRLAACMHASPGRYPSRHAKAQPFVQLWLQALSLRPGSLQAAATGGSTAQV